MRMRALFAALVIVAGVGAVSMADAQTRRGGGAPKAAPAPAPAPMPVMAPSFFAPSGSEPLSFAVQSYAAFQNDVGDLRGRSLANQRELDAALDRVAGHNRHTLSRGLLAYGALTAAQSPTFVAAVRETATFYGREQFIRGLMFDNGYARTMSGAKDAEGLILAALTFDGDRVRRIGDEYRQMAYGVQRERWGSAIAPGMARRASALGTLMDSTALRSVVPDMAARLAPAAVSASPRVDPGAFGGPLFWDSLRMPAGTVTTASQTGMPMGPPINAVAPEDRTLAINQMMTLAALYALDATKDASVPVGDLLTEPRTSNCFEMVQAQLRQCTSAARFHYETAFCLAEQGLQNMGACIKDGKLSFGS